MMSYDKASPNAKIGRSNSNDPELLEQLVREGKTNREIALILDIDYGSVASILYRYGIKRDPNRPCKRCGGPIGSTNTRQLYCKDCQKAMDSIRARKSSMKKAEPKKCEYCGKDYFGQPGQKYCSKKCYKDAAAAGKYKRPKNWIKRRNGKIDIEIRICGKTTERRESVDYFEAREIWHDGWKGGTMWMKWPRRRSPQRNRNAGSRQPITRVGRTERIIILRILEGEQMTVKDYYETIRDIERLAALVDAEGAVTLDYDDAEQIWALLLDYKDLLMAKEVE